MVKKLFAAIVLTFALVVAGQSKVDAADYYVGTYSDGTAVYLLTHTVIVESRSPYRFTCTIRAGR